MTIFNSITKYIPFLSGRRFRGKDLAGNKYYEYPNPTGGRMRRVIKYRYMSKMSDYTSGNHRLPIQWTSWLSYTRTNPPTIQELQKDATRQNSLVNRITEIEARERDERIRQGYLDPSSLGDKHSSLPYAVPGTSRIRAVPSFSAEYAKGQASDSASTSRYPTLSGSLSAPPDGVTSEHTALEVPQSRSTVREEAKDAYTVPTPTTEGVPPPMDTVDPTKYADKDDLRRLAEEDTKKRIAEQGGEVNTKDTGVQGVGFGSGGLQPRRRGK